ncbi:MAG: glycoside hydrolase domain-containing protein [Cellulosilyticaceae bacterium]
MSISPHFQIGLFDELEALYPDTNPQDGHTFYELHCASDTFATAHLMIGGLTPGDCVTFEVKGPHTHYKFFELMPVPVEHNTGIHTRTDLFDNRHNPYTIRKAPFMIYEALRPMRNILHVHTTSVAVAFRSLVHTSKRSEEKWEIHVTVNGYTQKLTLLVQAHPVSVPAAGAQTHRYVNWINLHNVADLHRTEIWSDRWLKLVSSYFRLAHYGRQNVAWLQGDLFFEQNTSGELILNEGKLSKLIELAEKAGLYYFQCATISGRKDDDWMASEAQTIITKDIIPGKGEATIASMGRQLYAYLKKHNLTDRWIQSFFDEPLDESAAVYNQGVAILKEVMPGIAILDANKASTTLAGSMTIWCPTVDCYELDHAFYEERLTHGDQVWVYTCLEPTGPYLNRLLDMERLRPVLLGWVATRYNVEGFLHWGGSYFGPDPYEQSCTSFPDTYTSYTTDFTQQLPAGDCGIFYPHSSGAISCTRLEAHRMGFEDLELIKTLEQKDASLAAEIVTSIARTYKDYDLSITNYRLAKAQLLAALA